MTSGGRIRLRLDAIRPAVLIEPVTSELSLEGELDQANRVGHEAAGDKCERLRRGLIEPLGVIHQTHQRLLVGRVGEQPKHRQTNQKAVRSRPTGQPEDRPQCIALRFRQTINPIQHRAAQLIQPRIRQLHLGLHTRGASHPPSRRPPRHVLQQCRLAHPRLTTQHQSAALTSPNGLQQPIKDLALVVPPTQRLTNPPRHGADNQRRRADLQ